MREIYYNKDGEHIMLTEKVAKLMNEQINHEFYSAYLYLSFSNYFVENGLNGFANWYQVQAQEERDHAMLLVKYLQNNEVKVNYESIKRPDNTWANSMEVLRAGLEHEKYITDLIHDIYTEAQENKDYRSLQFLDWYVKEQGEEEMNANELIKKFELFGDDTRALYLLDQELEARVYAAPSLVL
ncbi:ferritin [Clostridium cadaveris]|uniref:Ferritin n=2 Tax=Clostridiaceae TaxID=31979 RepID=A0A1I2PIY8_9CLOT|nr:ferritin [Clostridium cadaveris]